MQHTDTYGTPHSPNLLIQGDNLPVLKSLIEDYQEKITCIYIDPPYNTGQTFDHYEDARDDDIRLDWMKKRLILMRDLLSPYGSIWISIDDDQCHYLKVLCDEIFGRHNFVNTIIRQKKYSPSNNTRRLSDDHDYILCYAKDKSLRRPNLLDQNQALKARYKNSDNDPRGPWKAADFSVMSRTESNIYDITTPSGRVVSPPAGRGWMCTQEKFQQLDADNRIWRGKSGNNKPAHKKFLSEVQQGMISKTIWLRDEVGDNQDAKREAKVFNSDEVFATPKPEALLHKIIHLATKPGDIVLDAFLGSGTSTAVAHKMGRQRIGIEAGDHLHTHCVPRMQRIVDGDDGLRLSKKLGWKGGGGFEVRL